MKLNCHGSKQKNEQQQDKLILFVCVENTGRSQIAEGFFNQKYAPKAIVQSVLEPMYGFLLSNAKRFDKPIPKFFFRSCFST